MFSPCEVVCDSCEFVKNASDSHEAYDYVDEHEKANPEHKCRLQPRGTKVGEDDDNDALDNEDDARRLEDEEEYG